MIMAEDPNWRAANMRKATEARMWRRQCRLAEELREAGWRVEAPINKTEEQTVMSSSAGES
jgi:hypothetical protein